MLFAGVILTLLAVTVVSFFVGAILLARFASRLSTGHALMVLLLPPYTFYFAFYKLQVDGKELATALWMFGLAATLLLCGVFFQPLTVIASGNVSILDPVDPEVEKKKKQEELAKKLEEERKEKEAKAAEAARIKAEEEKKNFPLDMTLICEEVKNPALAEATPEVRQKVLADNISKGLKTDKGKALFGSFATLDKDKRIAALDAAAKEAGLASCSMIEVFKAEPVPEAPKP